MVFPYVTERIDTGGVRNRETLAALGSLSSRFAFEFSCCWELRQICDGADFDRAGTRS